MPRARTYSYPRAHRALEVVCIVLFFGLLAALGREVVMGTSDWLGALAVLGAGTLGYLIADFLSGLVHWAGDTVGHETWPVVGRNFILHFRNHHVDPKDITRHDFIETNGNNCIASIPPVMLAIWLAPGREGLGLFASALIGFSAFFVFATNQFHKWAHAGDDAPRIARLLQRCGLILRPAHHDVHHAAPHDKYYCITVGWMNPVLTKLRFFRFLEWVIARIRPSILHLEERRAN